MRLDNSLDQMFRGWRLTTAEILYHLPDHPSLLQTYVWQALDLTPKFPALRKFLDFWEAHLEGKLHAVTVCHTEVVKPAEIKHGTLVGYLQ